MPKQHAAVPKHVGFIMDGNRRWAKEHGLSTLQGHRRGYENMKRVLQWCIDRGIRIVTVFAFSMENWNRSKREVGYLMRLLSFAVKDELQELHSKGVRLNLFGRFDELPARLQQQLRDAITLTKRNTKAVLNLGINYGGRMEIVDAVRQLIRQGVSAARVDERALAAAMYIPNVPDPDLIIRTSGEQRLSGFMLWESAYAEYYFTPTKWPAFGEGDLDRALADYAQRKRNFGA